MDSNPVYLDSLRQLNQPAETVCIDVTCALVRACVGACVPADMGVVAPVGKAACILVELLGNKHTQNNLKNNNNNNLDKNKDTTSDFFKADTSIQRDKQIMVVMVVVMMMMRLMVKMMVRLVIILMVIVVMMMVVLVLMLSIVMMLLMVVMILKLHRSAVGVTMQASCFKKEKKTNFSPFPLKSAAVSSVTPSVSV